MKIKIDIFHSMPQFSNQMRKLQGPESVGSFLQIFFQNVDPETFNPLLYWKKLSLLNFVFSKKYSYTSTILH
jgi:hypothetical protein